MLESTPNPPKTTTYDETMGRSAEILMEYENLFRLQNNRPLSVLELERAQFPCSVKATIESVLRMIEDTPFVSQDRVDLAARIRKEFVDALAPIRWDVKCDLATVGDSDHA